ncbi:MAG TPA: hypothetical protein VI341_09250 [Actinomycetota bacterium]
MTNDRERALLVVMPLEDLRSALTRAGADSGVVLPAGGPGDLGLVPAGTPVLLMASDPSGDEVPAATWRASLIGRVPHEPGDPYPERLPSTWLERHNPSTAADDASPVEDDAIEETQHLDEDDDLDDVESAGPQSFFEVTDLRELPKQEWLFVNELVGKQARGGRTFFARVPMMVRLPD